MGVLQKDLITLFGRQSGLLKLNVKAYMFRTGANTYNISLVRLNL